ncbi:BAHD acyltransferase At5g47980 [Rosa chinensis]|uniref:BAHD acyltransferase At5g47980 n=1 Tax=Rosa chinensis TaxID=74649 RepID=UPI000D086BCA|nr:BAHD acyltransferase At5g47980 [Rosa chinensis]
MSYWEFRWLMVMDFCVFGVLEKKETVVSAQMILEIGIRKIGEDGAQLCGIELRFGKAGEGELGVDRGLGDGEAGQEGGAGLEEGEGSEELAAARRVREVMEKHNFGILSQLLPNDLQSTFESTGYLLLVQANFFECGGLAIGITISHKIADGFTLGTFIRSWAAMCLGSDVVALPATEFCVPASLYPQQDLFINSLSTSREYVNSEACVNKRFVFDASNIVRLKSKATSATVPNPTRVEVVTALLWKCAIEASRSNLSFTRPAMLFLAANMRKVLKHPNLMGNLVGHVFAAKTQEGDATLQSLVAIIRKSIEEFKVKYGEGVSGDAICQNFIEHGDLMDNNDINNYICSSWCRFGFYEANFGWGKPSWVTFPGMKIKNTIVLIDTKDGEGMEAFLSLKEEDMAVIETNKELLAYASLNPTVI